MSKTTSFALALSYIFMQMFEGEGYNNNITFQADGEAVKFAQMLSPFPFKFSHELHVAGVVFVD